MYTAEINLQPTQRDPEIAPHAARLYRLIKENTEPEQREYLHGQVDTLGGWIFADDCDPEMIRDCVDAFTATVLSSGKEIRVHLHIYEDNTLERLAAAE